MPEHDRHCLEVRRDAEAYGDVTLSVQASWAHYCKLAEPFIPPEEVDAWDRGRLGCAHVPLEHYKSVEIALWWTGIVEEKTFPACYIGDLEVPAHTYSMCRWITKPSEELGLDGFDDLWDGDEVAGYVPLHRVGQLQVALMARATARAKEKDPALWEVTGPGLREEFRRRGSLGRGRQP